MKITIYEQHKDGSPALWTEKDGDQLFVLDANNRNAIDESDLDAFVAEWRALFCDETKARCAYCGYRVGENDVPDCDHDDAWQDLAKEHALTCEWIATRAHQRTPEETVKALAASCAYEALQACMVGGKLATDSDGNALIDTSFAGPTPFDFEALQDAVGCIDETYSALFEKAWDAALHAELERLEASNA